MTPEENRDRAKRIIVELVRQAGGVFYNKTNLFKGFWRAHLAYADQNHGYLSNWPIVRMPRGPGIDNFDHLLAEMLRDDWLATDEKEFDGKVAMVFTLGQQSPNTGLDNRQIEAVKAGVKAVKYKSADFVSDRSHEDSRVWYEAANGQTLDIYLDLVPDEEREEYSRGIQSLYEAVRQR
jgi:hypothetical protein